MATIKSDNQGFLIGEPADIDRTFTIWNEIRDDMKAVRAALTGKGNNIIIPTSKILSVNLSRKQSQPPALPSPRVAKESSRMDAAASSLTRIKSDFEKALSPVATPKTRRAVVNKTSERDSRTGRFTKKTDQSLSGNERVSHDRVVENTSANESGIVRAAAEKIASAVSNASSGMEEADPAVKAFGEVAQPMARGYEILSSGTGREQRDKFKWFRRIFSELKLFRKEETIFNKAANNSLKNLEEKPTEGAQGDNSWLRRYIFPLAVAGFGALMTQLPKGFMDRIVNAHEKAISDIKSTLFTSPISHIIDKWDTIGSKLTNLLDSIGSKIESAWNSFTGFVKDKFGFDIPKAIAPAVDAGRKIKEKASNAVLGVTETIKNSSAGKAVSEAFGSAKDWVLGQTSKMFESGKGGAGTISSGKGDFGGASYGTYQLSSKQGTLQKFLRSSKYGAQFDGLSPGSPEFNAKWKEIAQSDPEFGKSQHDFIKATHFDPQMQRLNKAGIDLSKRGASVQDAVWSTAVQFGGNSSLVEKSLAGKDLSKLSDKDIVSAIQDYKIKNNESLFKNSSADVRKSTANRAIAERNQLFSLEDQHNSPTKVAQAQIASAPIPIAPNAPSAQPSIADAPRISEPIASSENRKPALVSLADQDVRQDVKDRRIAHIVTGGLSN